MLSQTFGGDNSLQGDLETRLSLPVAELREVDSVERHRVQLARVSQSDWIYRRVQARIRRRTACSFWALL